MKIHLAISLFLCYTAACAWGISTVGERKKRCPCGAFAESESALSESIEASRRLQRQQSRLRRLRLRKRATLRAVTEYGALAQLVARDIRIVEVRGSTPLCSTTETDTLHGCPFSLCGHGASASPAEDNATHWRGKAACDLQWRKSRRRLSQPIRSELRSAESRLYRLRNRFSFLMAGISSAEASPAPRDLNDH